MKSMYIPIVGTLDASGAPGASVVSAEATVEAAISLTNEQKAMLREASVYGRVSLRIFASRKSGSPSFTVDAIRGSFDDTNFVTLQSFAPLAVTANGELGLPEIVAHMAAGPQELRKIGILITVTTLDASNYISLFAGLVCDA